MDQRVRDIGEFELIGRLARRLPERVTGGGPVTRGIGDDAAVWTPTPGMAAVVTTDALVERIHFRLDWTDWASLGHKMLAVNISDVAAMGAVPRLATIVLGLTGDERVSDLERLYDGAGKIAAAFGVVIAGGDVVRVPVNVTIGVTLIGEAEPGALLYRDGARAGDLIVVSGALGASAAGLALLASDPPSTAATAPLLIAAHLRPTPRVALGRLLHPGGVTAAMDLSDGLLGDLRKMLQASGVAAEIDTRLLPILPAVRALFPERHLELALQGGEDYELLMMVPPARFAPLHEAAASVGATLTVVGRILDGDLPQVSLVSDGARTVVSGGAYDHFVAPGGEQT